MLNTRRILLLVIILLVLGLLVVLAINAIMDGMDTTALLIGLLIPLLSYALIAGVVEELGFGGVKARFYRVAAQSVRSHMVPPPMTINVNDVLKVGDKGPDALDEMIRGYQPHEIKPMVLSIPLGSDAYDRKRTLDSIDRLLKYPNFRLVVFLDQQERVKAYLTPWDARRLLSDLQAGEVFIGIVQSGDLPELADIPEVTTEMVNHKTTIIAALRFMNEHALDTLVAVDVHGRLQGIVDRDQILASIVLALVDR